MPLFVGIDGGGSRSRIAARFAGADVYEAEGASCNVRRTDAAEIGRVLSDLVAGAEQSFASQGGAVVLCAGLAGVSDQSTAERLSGFVSRALGRFDRVVVRMTGDVDIAHAGAFGDEAGILVIAGTGSIVYGRNEAGANCRTGGWGYALGDEGSGYALGRDALRAVAMHLDNGPETSLTSLIGDRLGLTGRSDILDWTYERAGRFQDVAPLLLKAAAGGDAVAKTVLSRQIDLLADLVVLCAKRLSVDDPGVAMVGGLTAAVTYRQALGAALARRLPDHREVEAITTPVRGALLLAQRLGLSEGLSPPA